MKGTEKRHRGGLTVASKPLTEEALVRRTVLLGELRLMDPVRSGGSATLYPARADDDRPFVIKTLSPVFAENDQCVASFREEAAARMRVEHPNLIRILEVGEDRGVYYCLTEHIEGRSLRRLLAGGRALEPLQAVRIIRSIAEAVGTLHAAGLVHRCIQPDNILLTDGGRAVLAERGCALYVDQQLDLLHSGHGLETRQYMAPEQLLHQTRADARSDVYSLGATFYTLVTGRLPFRGDDVAQLLRNKESHDFRLPHQINANLSRSLTKTIVRAMDADPRQRPQDVEAFTAQLQDDVETVGPYELIEQIGDSGAEAMFRARDPSGQTVAVRIPGPRTTADPDRLARFRQRGRLWSQLSHPNVAQVIARGQQQDRYFIATEFVDGETLDRYVAKSGHLTENESLRIATDVAEALDAVHQHGILHRCVNPTKILLTRSRHAKLAEPGMFDQSDSSSVGFDPSIARYLPPEQLGKNKDIDRRADIYALGACLYFMTTGCPPWAGSTPEELLEAKQAATFRPPEELNPSLSPLTASLIHKALQAEAARRPATADSFGSAAEVCLKQEDGAQVVFDDEVSDTPADIAAYWYVQVSRRPHGVSCLKATEFQVERLIRQGIVDRHARASGDGLDPFVPIGEIPVFKPLLTPHGVAGTVASAIRTLATRPIVALGHAVATVVGPGQAKSS